MPDMEERWGEPFFGKFLLFKSCLVSAQALKVVNFPEAFAAGGEDLSRCPWLRSVFTLQSKNQAFASFQPAGGAILRLFAMHSDAYAQCVLKSSVSRMLVHLSKELSMPSFPHSESFRYLFAAWISIFSLIKTWVSAGQVSTEMRTAKSNGGSLETTFEARDNGGGSDVKSSSFLDSFAMFYHVLPVNHPFFRKMLGPWRSGWSWTACLNT